MWTVFKKEIYRVLSDRRLILSVFIIPGLSIYLIYSLMGSVMNEQITDVEEHEAVVYTEYRPEAISTLMREGMRYTLYEGDVANAAEMERLITEGELDLVILFDPDFIDKVDNNGENPLPGVTVLYNQGRQKSTRAHAQFLGVMSAFHQQVVIDRLEDSAQYRVYDLVTHNHMDERLVMGQGLAMMLPILVVIFLFASAMSIGPDAIAGEKERGTIATLLVTPIERRHIALGKVLSLALLSLMGAFSAFIGIIASLPRLMQMDGRPSDMALYSLTDYLLLLVLLVTTVLFIVAVIALISAYAKTIKEATMLITPFYMLAIISGVMNSFGGAGGGGAILYYLSPIYGPIKLFGDILAFDYSLSSFLITTLSSLTYTVILVYAINLMFNNEKIMFSR